MQDAVNRWTFDIALTVGHLGILEARQLTKMISRPGTVTFQANTVGMRISLGCLLVPVRQRLKFCSVAGYIDARLR